MQTILGSGGAIGTELAKALTDYTSEIRLVSRNPKKVNETDELFPADILDFEQLKKAVIGSEIVYLTVGFEYSYKVWATNWPLLMRNLIDICSEEDIKLVFFDNIYMYDKDHLGAMTEETPVNPCSRKGEIRAEIAGMLMNEVINGNLKALIARSADFYGPGIGQTSILTETVFKPLSQGKKANWLVSDAYKHSFTFTPDAGKATAQLGNTDSAYGEVWHLPTAANPLTGKEWVEKIAEKMEIKPAYRTVPVWLVKLMGIFVPVMRESVEMSYQYNRDYVFKSDKFEEKFNFTPTSYSEGIDKILMEDYPGFAKNL
ncbi:MAG: NAD-dependent epimerase/dehydratase family protein [Gillisia sp.]